MAEGGFTTEAGHTLYGSARENYYRGDLNAHRWNIAVGNRLAEFANGTPQLLLALMDEPPIPHAHGRYQFDRNVQARATWFNLPARRNRLNAQRVFVLRGDSSYENLPIAVFKDAEKIPQDIQDEMRILEATSDTFATSNEASRIAGTIGLVLAIAGRAASLTTDGRTRRSLLSVASAISAAVALAPLIELFGGEKAAGAAQRIRDVTGPGVILKAPHEIYNAGRVALLIAKTREVTQEHISDGRRELLEQEIDFSQTQGSKTAVVVDEQLSRFARAFDNRETRMKVIAAYAEFMINEGKKLYAKYAKIKISEVPPFVTDNILDYLSLIEIARVDDPGGPDKQPKFPARVGEYVTWPIDIYCTEVIEATKHLRQHPVE